MSIQTVRFPFTSFVGVDAHYSLELQDYLTREEFDQRIRELNDTGKKSRINRSFTFIFLITIITIILLLAAPLWNVWILFIAFVVAMISFSFLNHKSRIYQFRAFVNKLNEFNANDNPRGINWRIDSDYGHVETPRYYNSYKYSHTIYAQKYLVIEISTISQITLTIPTPPPPAYHEAVLKNNRN